MHALLHAKSAPFVPEALHALYRQCCDQCSKGRQHPICMERMRRKHRQCGNHLVRASTRRSSSATRLRKKIRKRRRMAIRRIFSATASVRFKADRTSRIANTHCWYQADVIPALLSTQGSGSCKERCRKSCSVLAHTVPKHACMPLHSKLCELAWHMHFAQQHRTLSRKLLASQNRGAESGAAATQPVTLLQFASNPCQQVLLALRKAFSVCQAVSSIQSTVKYCRTAAGAKPARKGAQHSEACSPRMRSRHNLSPH